MFGLEICREEQGSSRSSVLPDQGAQVCRKVWIAAGAWNWEMCYEETSYRWEISQFTARGKDSRFFIRICGKVYGQDFLWKAKKNHGTPLGTETQGSLDHLQWKKEGREGTLEYFAQERCLYNTEALRKKKIEYPLYSLVMKLFIITTWFCLNSLEGFKVFQFLKGNFV